MGWARPSSTSRAATCDRPVSLQDGVQLIAALGALVISVLSYRRAGRAEARAEEADARDARREEREEREAVERRRGKPILTPGPIEGGPSADPVRHQYLVRNAGAAPINGLWLWIEAGGKEVSARHGGPHLVVMPGEQSAWIGVEVLQPLPDTEQSLWVEWHDTEGTHRMDSGIRPRRSA